MKQLLKEIIIYALVLHLVSLVFSGLVIEGGLEVYLIGGVLLTFGFKIVKPIVQAVTLPFQLLTFGLFNIVTIVGILYIATTAYERITITSFVFDEKNIYGYTVPGFSASYLLSFVVISVTIYLISKVLLYLFSES